MKKITASRVGFGIIAKYQYKEETG